MADEEIVAYEIASARLARSLDARHRFTSKDVQTIHKEIFGEIYAWAGEYRNVDLSKGGLMFTRAVYIDEHNNRYFEAVQAGMDGDLEPMRVIIDRALF